MQVNKIDINTRKIKEYSIFKKTYKISFLGGRTTPTYSICHSINSNHKLVKIINY